MAQNFQLPIVEITDYRDLAIKTTVDGPDFLNNLHVKIEIPGTGYGTFESHSNIEGEITAEWVSQCISILMVKVQKVIDIRLEPLC